MRKLFRRYAVYANVALLCLLCIGSLWTGLLVQLNIEHKSIIASAYRNNNNLARVFEAHVLRTIHSAENTLRDIAAAYQQEGSKYDLGRHLREHGDLHDLFTAASVLDEQGNVVLLSAPMPGPLNFSRRENYRFHLRNDTPELHISAPRQGTVTHKWTIYLSIRLNKANGAFGGMVAVGIDPRYFSNISSVPTLFRGERADWARNPDLNLLRVA